MGTVISVKFKNHKYASGACTHTAIIVDPELWTVECTDCGEKLDPIQWLVTMAQREDMAQFRLDELNKKIDLAQKRLRVKCLHCGKYTPIRFTEG